jgi:hypothetical protein
VIRRIMQDDPTSSGIAVLDERIANAKALFSAIKQSKYEKAELPRQSAFRGALRAVVHDIPRGEEYQPLREITERFANDPSFDSRSKTWHYVETMVEGELLQNQAKDVVNAAYNSAVACSLESGFLSSRRLIPLGSKFHRATHQSSAGITYFNASTEQRLDAVSKHHISWSAVNDALKAQPHPLTEFGASSARIALARSAAKSHPIVKNADVVTALATTAAGGGVVMMTGALTEWAAFSLAVLGAGAGALVKRHSARLIEDSVTAGTRRDLDGWLDL